MPDATALQQQANLLEERLAAKQAETDDKAALVGLATQLQQALAEAVAEKRPQAIALASQVLSGSACVPVRGRQDIGHLSWMCFTCEVHLYSPARAKLVAYL